MTKATIAFFLILLVMNACTNNERKVSKNEINPVIELSKSPQKTAQHVQVPNSDLYMIPPAGFLLDTVAYQLVKSGKRYDASFMVMKMYGINVKDYFASLKKDAESKYPGVWKEEETIISGHPAKIYQFPIGPEVTGHQLHFTDGSTEEMIFAQYGNDDVDMGNEMLDALKTVIIEK